MPQPSLLGRPLPRGVPHVWRCDPMSLAVALVGRSEIVVASDTLQILGDEGGYYRTECKKIRRVNQGRWALAVAGTNVGNDLLDRMEDDKYQFKDSFRLASYDFADHMKQLYIQGGYTGASFLLMCGVECGRPLMAEWSFPWQNGLAFPVAVATVGAKMHGALHYAHAYHSPQMDTQQLILLAYFCVSQAARQDIRVGKPIDIAVVREGDVECFSGKSLADVEKRCDTIEGQLREAFLKPGPALAGLDPKPRS